MVTVSLRHAFIVILAVACLAAGSRYSPPAYLFPAVGSLTNGDRSDPSAVLPKIEYHAQFLTRGEPRISEKVIGAKAALPACWSCLTDREHRSALVPLFHLAHTQSFLAWHQARAPPVPV